MSAEGEAHLHVAVLAGGAGSRLWPLSSPERPKPFVPLGSLGTLYGACVKRALALEPATLVAVGKASMRELCTSPGVEFLPEPAARNTGAAVALAAVRAWSMAGPEGLLLVLPSDHHIPDTEAFCATIRRLAGLCRERGALGILGIRPTGPESSYGYIQPGAPAGEGFAVSRFVEKPDRERAEELLVEPGASWNSGMFLLPLGVLREELALHAAGFWEAAESWLEGAEPERYRALPSTPFDRLVMERTRRAVVVPADFSWSDVGTFPVLYALLPKDSEGNAAWGPGRMEECRGCLVVTESPRTLVRGLAGQVVVETEAGLLVTPLAGAEELRAPVERLLGARPPSSVD
ncbi:MAG: mannose-1-phosphate guanylyltransferase [Acidobacteriota bacterium]